MAQQLAEARSPSSKTVLRSIEEALTVKVAYDFASNNFFEHFDKLRGKGYRSVVGWYRPAFALVDRHDVCRFADSGDRADLE